MRRNVVAADDDRRAHNEEIRGYGAAGERRRGDGDGYDDDETKRPTREELAGFASRLKLARAQLVSAEQRWNGLVERAEFYEALAGERDDDRGGAVTTTRAREEEGQYRTGEGEVRGMGGGSGGVILSLLLKRRQ